MSTGEYHEAFSPFFFMDIIFFFVSEFPLMLRGICPYEDKPYKSCRSHTTDDTSCIRANIKCCSNRLK